MKEQIRKTILLTGASGFVGKQVLTYLLAQNHTIIAPTRNPSKLSQFRNFDNLTIIEADIFTQDLQVGKYDILIHLAWGKMDNVCDFSHITHNFTQSLDFLQNAIKAHKIKQIAVAGSCFEYGSHYGKISEDFIPNPQTSYGIAKVFLQKALFELQKSYDFRLKWLRIFYLNGIGQNPHSLIPQLQNAIDSNQTTFNMSGGEQIRDYLDIKIAAKYIARLALDEGFDGICNVCSGEPISVRNLIENYLKKTRQDIKLNFGFYPYPSYEPLAYFGDNAKLSALLQAHTAENNIIDKNHSPTKNRKWGGVESSNTLQHRHYERSEVIHKNTESSDFIVLDYHEVVPTSCNDDSTLTVFARLYKKPKQSNARKIAESMQIFSQNLKAILFILNENYKFMSGLPRLDFVKSRNDKKGVDCHANLADFLAMTKKKWIATRLKPLAMTILLYRHYERSEVIHKNTESSDKKDLLYGLPRLEAIAESRNDDSTLTVFARLYKKPKQSIAFNPCKIQKDSTDSSDFSRFHRLFTHSIKLAQEVA